MPAALWALAAGGFSIGMSNTLISNILLENLLTKNPSSLLTGLAVLTIVSILPAALGSMVAAILTRNLPRKTMLSGLMIIFSLTNAICALSSHSHFRFLAITYTSSLIVFILYIGTSSIIAAELGHPGKQGWAFALVFTGSLLVYLITPFQSVWAEMSQSTSIFGIMSVMGLGVLAAIIKLVPQRQEKPHKKLRDDIRPLGRTQVLLSFAISLSASITISMMALVSNIASLKMLSHVLLASGISQIVGNICGGKLTDKHLMPTLVGGLALLAVTQVLLVAFVDSRMLVLIIGVAVSAIAYATVAPQQMRVLAKAQDAPNLASIFNIAASMLGNGIGCWLLILPFFYGSLTPSLILSATLSVASLLAALYSWRLDRRSH
jgi:DHA1 family inner membrane transport protein